MVIEEMTVLHGLVVRDALEAGVLEDGDVLVVSPRGVTTNQRIAAAVRGQRAMVLSTALPLAACDWVIQRAVRGLEVTVAPEPVEG